MKKIAFLFFACVLTCLFTTSKAQDTNSSDASPGNATFLIGNWNADTVYFLSAKGKRRYTNWTFQYQFNADQTGTVSYVDGAGYGRTDSFKWNYSANDSTVKFIYYNKKKGTTRINMVKFIGRITSHHLDLITYEDNLEIKPGEPAPKIKDEELMYKTK